MSTREDEEIEWEERRRRQEEDEERDKQRREAEEEYRRQSADDYERQMEDEAEQDEDPHNLAEIGDEPREMRQAEHLRLQDAERAQRCSILAQQWLQQELLRLQQRWQQESARLLQEAKELRLQDAVGSGKSARFVPENLAR